MSKILEGVFLGVDLAYTLVRVALFAAGVVCLLELSALAAKYGALIVYAMRAPTSF